jgi:hypothetical protein
MTKMGLLYSLKYGQLFLFRVDVYYLYNCVCDRDTCAFVPLYGYGLIDLASLTSYNCNINIIKSKYILFIVIFSKDCCANKFFVINANVT